MNQSELLKILESVKSGELHPLKAIERLKHLPFEDLGFAKVDHHRALRQGFAEVIFGKGKTPQQVAEIVRAMLRKKDSRHNILVTRADKKIVIRVGEMLYITDRNRAIRPDFVATDTVQARWRVAGKAS